MKRIRLTFKDANAAYEAADFISTNIDAVPEGPDRNSYEDQIRRLYRIWEYIKMKDRLRKKKHETRG